MQNQSTCDNIKEADKEFHINDFFQFYYCRTGDELYLLKQRKKLRAFLDVEQKKTL